MDNDESLYSVFKKLSDIRKKLAAIEEQKSIRKKKLFVSKVEEKLDLFHSLLKLICENQEKINNKKTTIAFKIPEKSLCPDNNSVQLAFTHHTDFINITLSKPKLEEVICDYRNCDDNTDLKLIIGELKNMNSSWRNEFFEQLCEYRSAKGLLDNIEQLKTIDKIEKEDNNSHKKSDSDLGCYLNDSATEQNTMLLQFATSSPISSKSSL